MTLRCRITGAARLAHPGDAGVTNPNATCTNRW
jgi:hypothetical protein